MFGEHCRRFNTIVFGCLRFHNIVIDVRMLSSSSQVTEMGWGAGWCWNDDLDVMWNILIHLIRYVIFGHGLANFQCEGRRMSKVTECLTDPALTDIIFQYFSGSLRHLQPQTICNHTLSFDDVAESTRTRAAALATVLFTPAANLHPTPSLWS